MNPFSNTPNLKVLLSLRSTLLLILISVLMAFMVGYASTYTVKPDLIKNFQEPQVPADKTGIYFIRGSKFVGGGRGIWCPKYPAIINKKPNLFHLPFCSESQIGLH